MKTNVKSLEVGSVVEFKAGYMVSIGPNDVATPVSDAALNPSSASTPDWITYTMQDSMAVASVALSTAATATALLAISF